MHPAQQSTVEFKYRPDVDGLRAIAVILVLLFHAGAGFTGGFIGVDVFFVISGFLITGLLCKEERAGTYSLAGFWVRRVRRIIPAASFIVAITLIVGLVLLFPSDLKDLAKSTIAQQLVVANIFFWRDTNYFAGPADFKPLLHTWSLAVEEQFYLFYPLLLITACRYCRRFAWVVLLLLAVISLGVSEWGVRTYTWATFYLLPTRAWELLIGALLVFVRLPRRSVPWRDNAATGLGLAAIVAAGWLYDSSTRFPGFTALIPCLATALIIYANATQLTWVARVLASRPLVLIGLISYPLYLWHWPILAFFRYWMGHNLPVWVTVVALGISFPLAYLTWRYIETPFRRGRFKWSGARLFSAAAVSAAILLLLSAGVLATGGLSGRYSKEFLGIVDIPRPERFAADVAVLAGGRIPELGRSAGPEDQVDYLIWDDSHAAVVSPLVDALSRDHGVRGALAMMPATPPLLDVWRSASKKAETQWNHDVFELIETRRIKHVILVARWAVYVEGEINDHRGPDEWLLICDERSQTVSRQEAKQVLRRGLHRTVGRLRDLGVKVWILKQVPSQPGEPRKKIVIGRLLGRDRVFGVSHQEHAARQANVDEVLASLPGDSRELLDASPWCFDEMDRSRISDPGGCYYADDDHLSSYGADVLLRELLRPVFAEIAETSAAPDN